MKSIVKAFVFSNYFIGLCATFLVISAANQLNLKGIPYIFYSCIFCATIFIYTYSSINISTKISLSLKHKWLLQYKKAVHISQAILLSLLACFCLLLLPNIYANLFLLHTIHWFILFTIIMVVILYFGLKTKNKTIYNLRKFGLLKPFLIAYVWAGVAVIIPYFYYCLSNVVIINFSHHLMGIYLNTFLFIAALAILYDFKDIEIDTHQKLYTFAVKFGVHTSITYAIIPMVTIGLIVEILLLNAASTFSPKLLLSTIPYIATILLAYNLKRQKSLWYYLALVDGLIFLKAIVGLVF